MRFLSACPCFSTKSQPLCDFTHACLGHLGSHLLNPNHHAVCAYLLHVQGYLRDNRKAQKAAYRRAADLLQACAAARKRQEGAAAADGAYEGALGLTRKLHYTGYVQVCLSVCNREWGSPWL